MKMVEEVREHLLVRYADAPLSVIAKKAMERLNDAYYEKTHPSGQLADSSYEEAPFSMISNGNAWVILLGESPLIDSETMTGGDDENSLNMFFRNLTTALDELRRQLMVVADGKLP
jgi:hypothetical protein